jgi:hypothetical protein
MPHPDDSPVPTWDDCDEPRPRRPQYRCSDGMCGAPDCPRCHPENFRDGYYVGEEE